MAPAPLAYKFVATTLMLAEVNYCATRLKLPINLPVKEQDLVKIMVFNPKTGGRALARLDTTNFSFSFGKPGRLIFVTRLEQGYQALSTTRRQGRLPTVQFLPQLLGVPSVIDTNGAYHLASNWLASIDVDVARLEREYPPVSTQWVLEGKGPKGPVPVFSVDWGETSGLDGPAYNIRGPAIRVLIAGDTKDLLYLRQEPNSPPVPQSAFRDPKTVKALFEQNISFSRRPALIKDLDKLLAISDEEFLKYTLLERSNLVARFAGIDHSADKPGSTTNNQIRTTPLRPRSPDIPPGVRN